MDDAHLMQAPMTELPPTLGERLVLAAWMAVREHLAQAAAAEPSRGPGSGRITFDAPAAHRVD